jgi:hypothetical protein
MEFYCMDAFSRTHPICNVEGSCNWPLLFGMPVMLLRATLLSNGTSKV